MENSLSNFKNFCIFLNEVRSHFLSRGFLETPTPSLVICPGMEPHLDAMSVELDQEVRYLPTSPEIHLKKRLCQGFEKIFELRPCFRKDPLSPLHRQEFFMLEWYRAHERLEDLVSDLSELLKHLKSKGFWNPSVEISEIGFSDLFLKHFGFDLKPDTSLKDLQDLFVREELYFHTSDSKVDLIHRALLERFERSFKGLTVLKDFPAEMAILSRIGESGFAQRFELYFDSTELANAFYEVHDPELQQSRWAIDQEERRQMGKPVFSMDEELLNLMKDPGMPEASGIALGLDRLFMTGRGLTDISEIGF